MVRLALDGTGGPVAVDGERRRPNLMVGGLIAMKALHGGTDLVETDPSTVSGLEYGLRGEHLVERVERAGVDDLGVAPNEHSEGVGRFAHRSSVAGAGPGRKRHRHGDGCRSAVPYTTRLGRPLVIWPH